MTEGSQKSYNRFYSHYEIFVATLQLEKFSATSVELWVTSLADEGRKHGAILSHISALKHYCIANGKDITFDTAKLRLVLRGIKNTAAPARLPTVVSVEQLQRLVRHSKKVLGRVGGARFSAMVSCAFYGFLRPSEYCISPAGHYVRRSDCKLTKTEVELDIRSFKHSCTSAIVRIKGTGDKTCPLKLVSRYLDGSRPPGVALFPITAQAFRQEFDEVIKGASIEAGLTPHSLRRGGATWAALNGWSDGKIRAFGRWKSDAFKKYIQI